MAFSLWLAFFGASVLLAIAPGPDNLFVLMQSAVFGVRAGMIVVLGLATGLLLQTLAAALGIAAVVAAVPALFWAIKCLGAAYLLWLAWQAWTHAKDAARGHDAVKLSGLALWRRGVVMNITNPKVQIFFLAFFPQFVPAGVTGWPLVLQMVIQGVTFIFATIIVFGAIAWGAGALADRLRSARFQEILNRNLSRYFRWAGRVYASLIKACRRPQIKKSAGMNARRIFYIACGVEQLRRTPVLSFALVQTQFRHDGRRDFFNRFCR